VAATSAKAASRSSSASVALTRRHTSANVAATLTTCGRRRGRKHRGAVSCTSKAGETSARPAARLERRAVKHWSQPAPVFARVPSAQTRSRRKEALPRHRSHLPTPEPAAPPAAVRSRPTAAAGAAQRGASRGSGTSDRPCASPAQCIWPAGGRQAGGAALVRQLRAAARRALVGGAARRLSSKRAARYLVHGLQLGGVIEQAVCGRKVEM
jgi:hypothetical protein